MDYIQKAQEKYTEKPYAGRSYRARRWARTVLGLLIFTFLYGVWQDRALAPPLHDGMHKMAAHVVYAYENADSVRAFVKETFGGYSAKSMEQEYDPITRWLLKWTS